MRRTCDVNHTLDQKNQYYIKNKIDGAHRFAQARPIHAVKVSSEREPTEYQAYASNQLFLCLALGGDPSMPWDKKREYHACVFLMEHAALNI